MGIFDLFGSSSSPFEEFHENGKVKIKGNKDKKGQLSGVVQHFSKAGFLDKRINLREGEKNGLEKEFYES